MLLQESCASIGIKASQTEFLVDATITAHQELTVLRAAQHSPNEELIMCHDDHPSIEAS